MFVEALKKVRPFTEPLIYSKRQFNGEVKCGMSAFIIVNDEGWILTSGHVLSELELAGQHQVQLADYERRRIEIESNTHLKNSQKRNQINRLQKQPDWITNQSFYWGKPGRLVSDFIVNPLADIAVGQIQNFDPKEVLTYPVFKLPPADESVPGTSICRLGFPFHNPTAHYDETKQMFVLGPEALPAYFFPNEGMITRIAVFVDEDHPNYQARFFETSTPGLRGQSGGPVFDREGNIWGLQSHTTHFELGFSPTLRQGNREVVENQFLNVGYATYVDEIIKFFNANKIKFNLSS